MKIYEQLCFDLLKEYQTTTTSSTPNLKTAAVLEILKKANVTDETILKTIKDIIETDHDHQNTNQNTNQNTSQNPTQNPTQNTSPNKI